MKTQLFSNTRQANNLIIYFAGWGTSPQLASRLAIPAHTDLLVCYDYQHYQLDFAWQVYQQIHIIAWSMGVWMAERVMQSIPFQQAIAINGTARPMDDNYGIPIQTFQDTLAQLSSNTRQKFERRMCGNRENHQHYQHVPARDLDNIEAELAWLYEQLQQDQRTDLIPWHKAILGEQDKIFPYHNMLAYWQHRTSIQSYPMPHYPFTYLNHWEQILCL